MKQIIIFTFSILLFGCGFQPIYKTTDASSNEELNQKFAAIKIEEVDGRMGYQLSNACASTFNPLSLDQQTRYTLAIKLDKSSEAIALQKNKEITRYNTTLTANYTLKDGNRSLDSGAIKMIGSYDATPSEYATYEAEQDVINNNLIAICEQLKHRLAVVLTKDEKKL
jgi:hypothetical protein